MDLPKMVGIRMKAADRRADRRDKEITKGNACKKIQNINVIFPSGKGFSVQKFQRMNSMMTQRAAGTRPGSIHIHYGSIGSRFMILMMGSRRKRSGRMDIANAMKESIVKARRQMNQSAMTRPGSLHIHYGSIGSRLVYVTCR